MDSTLDMGPQPLPVQASHEHEHGQTNPLTSHLHEEAHGNLNLCHLPDELGGQVVRLGQEAEAEGRHGVVAPTGEQGREEIPVFRRGVPPNRHLERLPDLFKLRGGQEDEVQCLQRRGCVEPLAVYRACFA